MCNSWRERQLQAPYPELLWTLSYVSFKPDIRTSLQLALEVRVVLGTILPLPAPTLKNH